MVRLIQLILVIIITSCVQSKGRIKSFHDNGFLKEDIRNKTIRNIKDEIVRKEYVIDYDSTGNILTRTKISRVSKNRSEHDITEYYSSGKKSKRKIIRSKFCGCFCRGIDLFEKGYFENGELNYKRSKIFKSYFGEEINLKESLLVFYPTGNLNKKIYYSEADDSITVKILKDNGNVVLEKCFVNDSNLIYSNILDTETDSIGSCILIP